MYYTGGSREISKGLRDATKGLRGFQGSSRGSHSVYFKDILGDFSGYHHIREAKRLLGGSKESKVYVTVVSGGRWEFQGVLVAFEWVPRDF